MKELILDLQLIRTSITIDPVTGCWLWHRLNVDGYGYFYSKLKRANVRVIRFVCEVFNGLDPDEVVLHACDTPACVNPVHLTGGTHKANSRDMVIKARQCTGEQHHRTKLTGAQVDEIVRRRGAGEQAASLAREYGVSAETLRRILRGETWVQHDRPKHVGHVARFSHDLIAEWVSRHENGESFRSLGPQYGCSYSTIAYHVRKAQAARTPPLPP